MHINTQIKNELGDLTLIDKEKIGYNKKMDNNDDGAVTLKEFDYYCDEHNINEKGREKLVKIMLNSKFLEELAQKKQESAQRQEVEKQSSKTEKTKTNTNQDPTIILKYKNARKAYCMQS